MGASLEGRVAVITGAGRGIGRAIAEATAAAGAQVVLAARSEAEIVAVASALEAAGNKAMAVRCDLTEIGAPKALIAQTIERFGKVDILVNNAATNLVANLIMMKEEQFRKVYELNVFAVMALSKEALRPMVKNKWGRIVNISSISAKTGAAYNSAYASSKAAVLGFTKSVAKETAQLGITVNAICPWHVETELLKEAMAKRGAIFGKTGEEYLKDIADTSPQKRILDVSEIASMAVYLMSDAARGVTGQSLNVDGGMLMD